MAVKKQTSAKGSKQTKKKPSAKPAKKTAKASLPKKKSVKSQTLSGTKNVIHQKNNTVAAAYPTSYNPDITFWPFYLAEHSHKSNRALHFLGSTFAIICVVNTIARQEPLWLLGALFGGYGFAWVGHFFIEKNRPATFKYPLKSFLADWRMYYVTLAGRIDAEYKKFGIETRG